MVNISKGSKARTSEKQRTVKSDLNNPNEVLRDNYRYTYKRQICTTKPLKIDQHNTNTSSVDLSHGNTGDGG